MGILLDFIYIFVGWELVNKLCYSVVGDDVEEVVLLYIGGILGLFGLV